MEWRGVVRQPRVGLVVGQEVQAPDVPGLVGIDRVVGQQRQPPLHPAADVDLGHAEFVIVEGQVAIGGQRDAVDVSSRALLGLLVLGHVSGIRPKSEPVQVPPAQHTPFGIDKGGVEPALRSDARDQRHPRRDLGRSVQHDRPGLGRADEGAARPALQGRLQRLYLHPRLPHLRRWELVIAAGHVSIEERQDHDAPDEEHSGKPPPDHDGVPPAEGPVTGHFAASL